ncbi:hypothetical protein BJV74DRAFT_826891 [Russula compacta]|nr:hypothetical protein BJV74DRAFT_826891 [Russula compacta]
MLLSSIAAIIFSASVVLAQTPACTRTHTVEPGEICDGISKAEHVSTYQLAVLNPTINEDCTNLVPGQTLCLGTHGQDCTATYVVQPNDICKKVTHDHHIDLAVLYHNNPQLNAGCTNMYIGEVLCVAPTGIAPPLPSGTVPATTIPVTAQPARPTDTDIPWCN